MKRLNKDGFTIIELLIATIAFSVMLLVITSAIIQFGRVYYKGVIQSRTQERARSISEDIAKHIQFNRTTPSHTDLGGSTGYICVGDRRYTYAKEGQLQSPQHVLVVDNVVGGCVGPYPKMTVAGLDPGVTELAGESMQLLDISVRESPSGSGLWEVSVILAYGESDDMEGTPRRCKSIILGGQFCAIAEFKTLVTRRI